MRSRTGSGGFTLIELAFIVVVVIAVIMFGIIGGVCRGNFWVGEESALKAVQRVDPAIIEVVALERHVWAYSKVFVRDQDGKVRKFAIDANILQNRRAMALTD